MKVAQQECQSSVSLLTQRFALCIPAQFTIYEDTKVFSGYYYGQSSVVGFLNGLFFICNLGFQKEKPSRQPDFKPPSKNLQFRQHITNLQDLGDVTPSNVITWEVSWEDLEGFRSLIYLFLVFFCLSGHFIVILPVSPCNTPVSAADTADMFWKASPEGVPIFASLYIYIYIYICFRGSPRLHRSTYNLESWHKYSMREYLKMFFSDFKIFCSLQS